MLKRDSSVAAWPTAAAVVGIALAGACLGSGCGQKGPLTLPKPLPASSPPSAPASAAVPS